MWCAKEKFCSMQFYEWEMSSIGSHIWIPDFALVALFGKVMEPLAGGDKTRNRLWELISAFIFCFLLVHSVSFLLLNYDISFSCSCLHVCQLLSYLPAIKDSCPSGTTSHINTSFHNHDVSSQQPKAMAIKCVLLLKWWKSFAEFDEIHWRDECPACEIVEKETFHNFSFDVILQTVEVTAETLVKDVLKCVRQFSIGYTYLSMWLK